MSAPKKCRNLCGAEIALEKRDGRWIPREYLGGDWVDHDCPRKPSKPCKRCGAEVVWRGERLCDAGTSTSHECEGLVDPQLRHPSGHHVSSYRIRRFSQCELRSYFADVLGLDDRGDTDESMAGKIIASAVEYVGVSRHKASGRAGLRAPITPDALLAAVEVVLARQKWTFGALEIARRVAVVAAAKLDLSCVVVDEHGPVMERNYKLACGGGGIEAGLIVDYVEQPAPDEVLVTDVKSGGWRDPRPLLSPQVGLYLAKMHELWPEARVRFVLKYVALDGPDEEIFWTREIEEDAKAKARAMVTKSRVYREDEAAWPATFGTHCQSCPFQARCSTYQARMREPVPHGDVPSTLAGVAAELHRLAPVATIYSNRVSELREAGKRLAGEVVDRGGRALAGRYPIRLQTIHKKESTHRAHVEQRLYVDDPVGGDEQPSQAAELPEVVSEKLPAGPPRVLSAQEQATPGEASPLNEVEPAGEPPIPVSPPPPAASLSQPGFRSVVAEALEALDPGRDEPVSW